MDVADELIEQAGCGRAVHLGGGVVLVSAEALVALEGEAALGRFEADRAAGRRTRGIPHDEVLRRLGR